MNTRSIVAILVILTIVWALFEWRIAVYFEPDIRGPMPVLTSSLQSE